MNPEDQENDQGYSSEDENEEINPEDIQQEIILEEDENILPESDEEGEDDGGDSFMDNQAEDENLDTPVMKFSHTGEVYSVKFNPTNPKIIASGSGDDSAKLWNLDDQSSKPLTGHTDSVCEIQFSPDGSTLATCGLDAFLKLWDVEGNLIHTLEGPSESIECCAWHPRGPIIIAGGGDGTAWMWGSKKGECMGVFSGHSDAINCISFSGDGKRIITGSSDCTVRIWDPKNVTTLHTIKDGASAMKFHQAPVTALKCSTANDIFVTGGEDGFISICDSQSGKIYGVYEGHTESVESIEILTSLSCVASSSMDKTIQIFDIASTNIRSKIKLDEGVIRIRTHPDFPNILVAASLDGFISVWDYRTATLVKKIAAHSGPILDICLSPGGILSGGEDCTVKLWNLQ
jgi:ribosome assembly protein SQT1